MGGALTSLSPLAALTNWGRLFVNLLRGVTRFRRGRYRCWSCICARHDGLGNNFIGGRFEASTQSQEAKRWLRSALRILDALRYKLKQAKATLLVLQ
jgi:hypothetical protein